MKLKLIAGAVGLALAGPVFADSASIYQYGTDNFAAVDQTNSGAGAYVNQYGDRNHVGYDYGSEYGIYPGITQVNVASGYASTSQQGNDNFAWVYQYEGANLTANIQQGGWYWNGEEYVNYGNASGNYASVGQYYGDNMNVMISQFGSNNGAYTYQYYGNNQSNTFQDGSGNYSTILQNGGGSDANIANVTQTGNSNQVYDYYYYYGINQSGSGNQANITQTGDYNRASANQYGTGNQSTINQTGLNHYATTYQSGTTNVAVVNQH